GLLDVLAELLVLVPGILHRPLMHRAAADDQVDQHADQRDEQHEQEPQRLGPPGQVTAAEDVDEDPDQDPDPDDPQEQLEYRPEDVQQRIGRIGSYRHSFSFAPGRPQAIAPRWQRRSATLAPCPEQAKHFPGGGSSASPNTGETHGLPSPTSRRGQLPGGPAHPAPAADGRTRRQEERSPQPGRLSTAPAAMARTSWAWSRSFWSAYNRANRPIASGNFRPFPR